LQDRKNMKNPKNILITGGSSGIGRALALQYADEDITLMLTGRNIDGLNLSKRLCEKKYATVKIATIDVTNENKMRQQILKWDAESPIDLTIANAGMGLKGCETDAQTRTVFDINLNGVLNTIQPVIPKMKDRKSGQVVLMSSLAAFRGMPGSQAYSASKAAVRFYGEAIRPELAAHNIQVSVICPGFIKTPLTDKNEFKMPFMMDDATAAKKMIKALKKNKARISFPLPMYLFCRAMEIMPNIITDAMLLNPPKK